MNETKLYETLAKMRDMHSGIAGAIDELIQTESKQMFKEYEIEKIVWQTKTGERGEFELADDKENQGNTDFEAFLADLKQKERMTIKPYFYWLFSDGKTIGRKKTKYSQ